MGLFFAATDNPEHEDDAGDFQGEDDEELNEAMNQSAAQQPTAPQSASQSSNAAGKKKASAKRGVGGAMTLRDLQASAVDDDDEDDKDKKRDLFAGGEKSGLAVQDPNSGGGPIDHFRNIMNQARQNRSRPGDDDEVSGLSLRNYRKSLGVRSVSQRKLACAGSRRRGKPSTLLTIF